eukprot:1262577-Rhodomonas_salina.1
MPVPDEDCLTYRPQFFARTRARSSRSVTNVTFLYDPIAKAMTKIHAWLLCVCCRHATLLNVRGLGLLQTARWFIANGSRSGLQVVRVKNKFAIKNSSEIDGYQLAPIQVAIQYLVRIAPRDLEI